MPRLLAAKQYPALVDVYHETTWVDPDSGEIFREWQYDEPYSYRCNFMSLKGHAEKFGAEYGASNTVKVEVRPEDAKFINLSMRFGNLRMTLDDDERYYAYVGPLLRPAH